MGIHDRGYYREEQPRGRPGLSRFSAWSVTTWLIAINVSIFVLDSFLSRSGVPVYRQTLKAVETMPPASEQEVRGPYLDGSAREVPPEAVRTVGAQVQRAIVHTDTGDLVGFRVFEVMRPLEAFGHFSTYTGFQRLEVWRLVTFQFLHSHASIWHLALNMLGLFVFGPLVEEQLGRRRYLAFYLMSGICGGLAYLVLNLLGGVFHVRLPGLIFESLTTPLVGASAGVFGVIMACAYIAPNSVVRLIFPPIPLKMRTFAYAYVAFAAFNLLIGGHNAGGDAAHLGGAIAGAFFIRNSHLLRDFFDVFGDSRKQGRGPRPRNQKPPPPPRDVQKRRAKESEIDAVLDKISSQGIQSLTAREKKLLQEDTRRRRES